MKPKTTPVASFRRRSVPAFTAAGVALALLAAPEVRGQAFDCVRLNEDNTNIFTTPDECGLPENVLWCNCVRSLFTFPVKGQLSGFNQAIQWIYRQPGIANHRVEVPLGTLNLAGVQVGEVIGETFLNELIPQSAGVPPGTFFTVKSEVRVTLVQPSFVDFDVVITQISPAVIPILRYDPLDANHNTGLFYRGRLASHGPGRGFTLEYRYPAELVVPATETTPARYPAIQPNDADSPGFTVRFLLRFFTTESGLYTLPDEAEVQVETTLRRFTERALDEVLLIDEPDLCQVVNTPDPCKLISEELQIKNSIDENSPPTAIIKMIDPENATLVLEPAAISTHCGAARLIFRGADSDDGDGGTQALSYEWSIKRGPADGAAIPDTTRNFKDTEITFTKLGEYEVGLRIDDLNGGNSTDETSVIVSVDNFLDINLPPSAAIATLPDPPEVALADGKATVELDGSLSSNGPPGIDDCSQTLTYSWRVAQEPVENSATLLDPQAAKTSAVFTWPGQYIIELEVDDGQPADNISAAEVVVIVTGIPGGSQLPGDCNQDESLDISDAVCYLGHLFLGDPAVLPCEGGTSASEGNRTLLDFNGDGAVDITDPVTVLGRLFLGEGPHVLGEDCVPIAGCPNICDAP